MRIVTMTRKPCSGGSATNNVIGHQAGALNIDGCRVGYLSTRDFRETVSRNPGTDRRFVSNLYDTQSKTRPMQRVDTSGRWPANVVLVHRPECHHVGAVAGPGYTINRWTDGAKPFGGGAGHEYESKERSEERIPVWDCVDSCAVGKMDEQSGVSRSGAMRRYVGAYEGDSVTGFLRGNSGPHNQRDDVGTAARFFKQVQSEEDAMSNVPRELWDYLYTMIAPPPSCEPIIIMDADLAALDLSQFEDSSVHGMITVGNPELYMKEIDRVLKPGAHLLLIAPDTEPTGHTGACAVEDFGYEIRDAIALLDAPAEFHYVAKASTSERNAGVPEFRRTVEVARLFPADGVDVEDLAEDMAEHLEEEQARTWLEEGLPPHAVPEDLKDKFVERKVSVEKVRRNDHPCLHPDDLVMTARGYRPLTEVQTGDLVYSQDGRFHVIEEVTRHPYAGPCLYEIRVIGTNYTTRASNNHPFLVWRPVRERRYILGGHVLWLDAADVQRGDYTMTPIMEDEPLGDGRSEELAARADDEEFWFMFGLYLAEGSIHTAGPGKAAYPSYGLGDHEDDLHLRIDEYFAHVKVGIYEKESGTAVAIIPFDAEAGRIFLWLGGKGAATKSLRPEFWSLSRSAREAVYEGYMAGDGGDVRNHRQCKTVSQDLASQMWLLSEGLGYKANLFRYPGTPGGIGDRVFKSVSPEHQMHFYSRNQALQRRQPSRPTHLEHEGRRYLLRYVKEVREVPYEGDVMNLSVEGSPTFMTPVGMTHNTCKPVGVMERLLADVPKDALVVDPFVGSGTTGIACLRTGHDFVGIEQDAEYLKIADQRIRYWDRAEAAWQNAEIESEAELEEDEPMTLEDLFGG